MALSYTIADDDEILKYHVSTALRTAVHVHVSEILRDAGLKAILCQIVILKAHLTSVL
jgi:hypothetical protein